MHHLAIGWGCALSFPPESLTICRWNETSPPKASRSCEPVPAADTTTRSPAMGKGNKVRKKEVKKPKQDKKIVKK
jgi:hypothetical protein